MSSIIQEIAGWPNTSDWFSRMRMNAIYIPEVSSMSITQVGTTHHGSKVGKQVTWDTIESNSEITKYGHWKGKEIQ